MVGKQIIGENLTITNQSGTFSFDDNGFTIKKDGKEIILDTSTPKIYIKKNGAIIFDTEDINGNLDIKWDNTFINLKNQLCFKSFYINNTLYEKGTGGVIDHSFEISPSVSNSLGWVYMAHSAYNTYTCLDGAFAAQRCTNFIMNSEKRDSDGKYDMTHGDSFIEMRPYCLPGDTLNGGIAEFKSDCDVVFHGTVTFNGNVWGLDSSTTSDLNFKENIVELNKENSLNFINSLTPLSFTYKGKHKRTHMGFGAQTVRDVCNKLNMGDMAIYDARIKDNKHEGRTMDYSPDAKEKDIIWALKYTEFIAPMVSCIQLLNEKLENVEKELKEIKNNG